ncbi:MAG TPA: hypothetical protein VL614_05130 [Acetobacteraceae bacterium]|jgi:hypothetical protein|nr:hypothetical protein [Acetobacteraceae bacterium]
MTGAEDFVELARELASIASATTDPAAARRLVEIVERLLSEAGLPPGEQGGGETPTGWLSEPVCDAA